MQFLENKVALITGGSKGIGFGIAEALMWQGIHVAITSRTKESVNEAVNKLKELCKGKAQVIGIKADVKNYKSQENAVKEVVEKFGKLDILVANAGLGYFAPIDELTLDQWNETIDTNLTGVFYSIKASVEELKKTKGYVITISSLAGANFFAGGAAYNASKFGVTGFSQAVMLDLRKYEIKVTTIMPGSVATHFNNHVPNGNDDWKIQKEDIGSMVVDLLRMNPRTLPSKIEVRPSIPPSN
ncbi:MAG: short-chain dehydrogenase [Flavobacteriaceae bacterium CG_4_8_14_3_um_filter_34_10]|nr:SDR family oxidoreductase [Flavobacteriia bacterium]OIP52317.1 MAG: short-chain dehydrogenase [Flavobacteriaceae bacterium CG2_30_34_30]PIQ17770.1 MAG: short-chain dehydrogenase [Flavobacteriaceae bacterium CG18_big_fil_WC_8_21_14_2_50_34_36]PIV50171.1 MAG: short-chain dehydrogenase [Flavobacteriaceae bacterium CG02_land_8_20_14_3_00_34_13]PIX09015.1 MAG: short-chain dehydrogenase [Flavobacteriaceae bacterium CG_4_8_14_3_um_filter_34_10]PIZ08849.1 MAG: short-chain dehydrogenase [Flavobacter